MSWIRIIDEGEADGRLAEVYDGIIRQRGKMSNIMRVQSLMPDVMEAHMDLYLKTLFGRSGLRRAERELIATVVSAANGCAYCTHHHAEALQHYWKDRARVEQAMTDYTALDLPAKTRAVLDYAVKLTRRPEAMTEADVEPLRAAGCDDDEILHVALVAGYFNFVNRIASGLGVAFSEEEVGGYRY